ncbi:hypothetical protein REISMN_00850 [Rickettsia tamurae subsp. buchneri]|uniref:RNA methyltransferase n=1 Tax=Rickettsia tamurae subsp. buchneri TaxID=1462938 RepID=A0A8E0WMY1_9RICK|nr:tRNA/rRNA methyltransferase [Rickettsia endosymbiont of Ixodes scapularis]KDO03613.1 hypothetical protein REISMN_00850 [Rickettsia tamurae subsp. buchneri]
MNPIIILVAPQMGENISATARAIKNFGLNELGIVAPIVREQRLNSKNSPVSSFVNDAV